MPHQEAFKPVSIKPPSKNAKYFILRCLVDVQLKTIATHLKPVLQKLNGEVIDIGAGESPWREWLSADCRYTGLDVEQSSEFGMSGNRPDVIYYNGKEIPFDSGKFDGALCIEVLEHAEAPKLLLMEIYRILKPGGTLLLSVPWSARRHHIPYDYQRFSREKLLRLLNQVGYDSISIEERGGLWSVIANKMIVLTTYLMSTPSHREKIINYPLALLIAPMAATMLIISHLVEGLMKKTYKEDPLGYFVVALKPEESKEDIEKHVPDQQLL